MTFRDWKSFAEATLEIDQFSVLIGMNASGKSNVVDAFTFLNRIGSGSSPFDAISGTMKFSPLRGGHGWAARKGTGGFSVRVRVVDFDKSTYIYQLECSARSIDIVSESLVEEHCDDSGKTVLRSLFETKRVGFRPGRMTLTISGHVLSEDVIPEQAMIYSLTGRTVATQPDLARAVKGAAAVIRSLQDIRVLDPNPRRMRRFAALSPVLRGDGSNLAGVLASLVQSDPGIEDVLTATAREVAEIPVERVYAENEPITDEYMALIDEQVGGGTITVTAEAASDGTLRLLAILIAVLSLDTGGLLVIDEIDSGLHPSRSGVLIDAVRRYGRERGGDILITTQSETLLDAMGPDVVPFVTVAHRDHAEGTSRLTLLENVERLPKLLAQGGVGRLSSKGLIERALEHQAIEA